MERIIPSPSPLDVAASRFHPPVQTATWVSDCHYRVHELLRVLPERLALTGAQMAGICHHESVFVGGNRLRCAALDDTIPAQTEIKVLWFSREPEPIPLTRASVMFEDDELIVVNKPAWLPTQGIPSSARYAVEPQLRALLGMPTLMALHRLDRQTSGVLVFAKHGEIAGRYMQLFTQRLVEKRYFAVTTAIPASNAWTMHGYLSRDYGKLPRVYFRLTTDEQPKSRWSETNFRVLATRDGRTLLEARPVTGRTHQIRVHLAASRCYVLGDTQYGYPSPAKHAPASRLQLHARAISWPAVPRLRVPAQSLDAIPAIDFLFPVDPSAG